MENASKALLIAAGVLIVILLIAFGMSVFNSTGDTSADAKEVGEAIKSGTADAKAYAISSLTNKNDADAQVQAILQSIPNATTDHAVFKQYIIDNYDNKGDRTADEIRVLCKLLVMREMEVSGTERKTTRMHIANGAIAPAGTIKVKWENTDTLESFLEKIKDDKKYKVIVQAAATGGKSNKVTIYEKT